MKIAIVVVAGLAICTTSAVGAPRAASPFQLVVSGEREEVPSTPAFPQGIRNRGTFTASSPFCPSGTFVDVTNDFLNSFQDTRLYTCSNGTGTLTTRQEHWFEVKPPFTEKWSIVEGTGRYAELRGQGTFRGEILTRGNDPLDPIDITFRSVLTGLVAFDTAAPTISISSARAAKLRRPAGTYVLSVSFSIRDANAGDGLSYFAAADARNGGLYLATKKGTTVTGKVMAALRFKPSSTMRTVLLELRAADIVGNRRVVTRLVKLPR